MLEIKYNNMNKYFSYQVHLCEASDITNLLGDDFLVNRTGSRSMLVAVKMLRPDVGEQARYVAWN